MIKLKELLDGPVEKYLFHATFNALIPQIEMEGLVPGGGEYVNFEGSERGVYLSNDKGFAGSMVQNTENENIPDEWLEEVVIIVVDTSKLNPTLFDKDPHVNMSSSGEYIPKSYIYKGIIPPSAFKEIVDFEG